MNPQPLRSKCRFVLIRCFGEISGSSRYRFLTVRLLGLVFMTALTMGATCAQPVVVPPSGSADTANQPASVVGNRPVPPTVIISGPGFEILIDAINLLFLNHGVIVPGGSFPGGDRQSFNGQIEVHLVGTGSLAGWQRWITLPINGFIDSDVRPYGANVQSFPVAIFNFNGQIMGDPDFDLLRVRAGSLNGLPSPGHTTLTRMPNNDWNYDSHYDVMYRVEYVGAAGGVLAGQSGNEIRQQHVQIGVEAVTETPPVDFTFSTPQTNNPAQVLIDFTPSNGNPQTATVSVNPGDTVTFKRDQAVTALNQASVSAVAVGADGCTVGNIAADSVVRVTDLGSGEASDRMTRAGTSQAVVAFPGFFNSFDAIGQPSIFTAGIVTDVGELSAQVSAAELNFQTDGPIICQALFQRLAPRAPDYGASINYAGDRLDIYFDPAYTVTQGGIFFGTTSPSPGNYGQLEQPPSGSGWTEQGDAMELLPGQHTNGFDPLPSITGTLTPMNDVDLYCIRIIDPQQFQASTVGGASFDTQLFLFDEGGMGVTHNDDAPTGGTQSRITGQFVPGPGIFYIAISAYNRDGQNPGGLIIWNDTPFNVERAPDGPGAPGPLAQWGGNATPTGSYTIQLNGCGYCDPAEPPIPLGNDPWAVSEPPEIRFGFGGSDFPPIPADFFAPGSKPFHGIIEFGSKPYDRPVGNADTIVERMDPLELPQVGSTDNILVRFSRFQLESVDPIIIEGEAWRARVTLPLPQPLGTMTVSKTHLTGGTWQSSLPLTARFEFTPVEGGSTLFYDPGVEWQLNTVGSGTWSIVPPPFAQPGGGPGFFPDAPIELLSTSGLICRLEPAVADGLPEDCPTLDPNRDNQVNGLDIKLLAESYVQGPSHPSFCAVDANANGLADGQDISLTVFALLNWPMAPESVGGWIDIKAECNFKHHKVTECDNAPPFRTRRILVQAADKDGNPSNCEVKFRLYNCDGVPDGPSKKVEQGDRECAIVDSNRGLEVWCLDGTEPCRISIKEVADCPPPEE